METKKANLSIRPVNQIQFNLVLYDQPTRIH